LLILKSAGLLANDRFDPIAEVSELPEYSGRAFLLRLFGDGWAPFFKLSLLSFKFNWLNENRVFRRDR
jgi:hypothetical protein